MRQIDPDILSALESGELRPFYYLDIEVDSTHYRYTSCEIPLIIDGEKYEPKPFQVENINYSMRNVVDSVVVRVENAEIPLTSVFLDSTPQGSDVIVGLVLLDSDHLLIGATEESVVLFSGIIDAWKLSDIDLEMTVASIFVVWSQVTLSRHPPSCRWRVFGGTECKYVGDENECDRTYVRCTELNNTDNFGGFRWLPSIEKAEIWWGRTPK